MSSEDILTAAAMINKIDKTTFIRSFKMRKKKTEKILSMYIKYFILHKLYMYARYKKWKFFFTEKFHLILALDIVCLFSYQK